MQIALCTIIIKEEIGEVKEIRNPYFGSEMLDCGTVKEELN